MRLQLQEQAKKKKALVSRSNAHAKKMVRMDELSQYLDGAKSKWEQENLKKGKRNWVAGEQWNFGA